MSAAPRPDVDGSTPMLTFHADAYRAGACHPAHEHDALHFSLVLSGRVTEVVNGVTEWAGALSVVAKDPGVVHADDFGPLGARLARLTLPAGTIGSLIDDPARFAGWRWTHDPLVAAPFLRLVRRATSGRIEIAGTGTPVTFVFSGSGTAQSVQLQGITFARIR